jgi:cell division protein FtsI (penicillin-binding protein 3)
MKDIKTDILWRVYLLYLVMLIFGAAIILRVIYIQAFEGAELHDKANKQMLQYFDVEAERGDIYACDGSLLATSVPIFDIRMDVASPLISKSYFNRNVDALAGALSKLFRDKPKNEYKRILTEERKQKNRYFLVKRNVTYDQLEKVKTMPIFERGKYKGGLIIVAKSKRQKPFGSMASRIIGYRNEESGRYVGIEGAYDEELGGKTGKQLMRKINNGDWVPVSDNDAIVPESGKDIVTTLDVNLQDVAETSLLKHLSEHNAKWGCAIVMEVETGAIKAIANLERDKDGQGYSETYNYAIGWSMEPGSTFKLASMIALIEDGLDNLDDTIDIGNGITKYFGLKVQDVHKIRNGMVSIREVFEQSSNVGISKLVTEKYSKKPQRFIERLYDMSLNEKNGIELQGEPEPRIKDTKSPDWWKGSLPFIAHGYEIKLTPLQTLTFFNAVANDGKMVKPVFVKEIWKSGRIVDERGLKVINSSICSRSTIKKVKELLEGVVQRGTADILNKSVYKIAGKTGTAKIASSKGYESNYNASFVGYFPADNPKYSCIVVISRPSEGGYYASTVAVPVFKEIADRVYATHVEIQNHEEDAYHKIIYPTYALGPLDEMEMIYDELEIPMKRNEVKTDWAIAMKSDSLVKLEPKSLKRDFIPNVKGMGAKDAVYVLESLGLKVFLTGKGFVREQSIPAGSKIIRGSQIYLKLTV